jgi:hypothetical protein
LAIALLSGKLGVQMTSLSASLRDTRMLDRPSLEKLEGAWIRTLGDLVGALESDPASVKMILNATDDEVEALRERAESLLDDETREAVAQQRGQQYGKGALDPSLKRNRHAS